MRYVSLPIDLVMEIMSRAPGKSLARFRSVSKQFKSLLSDPCFLRLHHSRSRDSLFTIAVHRSRLGELWRKFNQIRYNFFVTNKANGLVHKFTEIGGPRFRMLSSHHQLLCFVSEAGIHLCDPVNKEFKKLPDPPSSLNFFISNECLVSFGFIEATMQYKVVKWPYNLEEKCLKVNELKFEVLNIDIVEDGRLKVSPWRMLQRPCPYLLQLSSQVHVNGFIYWITSDFQIVSFSLQDETFSTLDPKPMCFRLDPEGSKKYHFSLSGSRGNLWMIYYDVLSKIMEIWKMEESCDGWDKIYKIDLRGTHPKNDVEVQMLDIRSDQVLFKLWLSPLIRYDANTNTLKTYGKVLSDYQLCHSTDRLLSLHNIDMFKCSKECSKKRSRQSFR